MADQTIVIDVLARARTGQLKRVEGELRSMGRTAKLTAGEASLGISTLGRASQAAGTALLVGVGAALAVGTKAAIDFESSFAGVRKTVEASEGQFERLARNIRDLSLDIPVNVNELNRIAELGGQLGIGAESLTAFTEVIAKLGATTNLEIDEAATTLARFANVMGTSQGDFDRIGSTVVDLGNNFATTEAEILTFGTRLAGIGVTVGASEADILGLATAFTSLGEPAERGATALQTTFITMLEAVEQGGRKLELFAEVAGTTTEEFARIFGEDPVGAFIEFEKGLGKIIETGGGVTTILDALGLGARRTTGLLLKGANGWEILADAVTNGNDAYAENIALNVEAEKRFETTASRLTLLGNNARDALIEFGNTQAVRSAIDLFSALIDVLKENTDVLAGFATLAATILASRVLVRLGTGFGKILLEMGKIRAGAKIIDFFGSLAGAAKFLSGWVGALAIGFGAVAIAMANARAKTNRMREAVERLNEVLMEGGPDGPSIIESREAFIEAVENATASGLGSMFAQFQDIGEVKKILQDAKFSFNDFIDAALTGGQDYLDLEDEIIARFQERVDIERRRLQALGYPAAGDEENQRRLVAAERELTLVTELLNKTGQVLGINRELTEDVRRQRDLEDPFTMEQELAALQGGADMWEEIVRQLDESRSLSDAIQESLGPEGDVQKVLDDWTAEIMEFGEDFGDAWADIITDFSDKLNNWEAIWDGYEAAPAPSLTEIRNSIQAWRTDSERFLATQEDIFSNYSVDHQDFWLSLPEDIQRGLAALRAESPEQFATLFGEMFDENNLQIGDVLTGTLQTVGNVAANLMKREWPQVYATAARQAGEKGIAVGTRAWAEHLSNAVTAWVLGIEAQSPEVADALITLMREGINKAQNPVSELGGTLAPGVVANITADMTRFERINAFYNAGYDWATATLLGFLAVDLPNLFADEAFEVVGAWDGALKEASGVQSPSKLMMDFAEDLAAGFNIGINNSLDLSAFDPILRASGGGSISNVTEIHVHHPNHPSDDLTADLQRATTLAGFQRIAEVGGINR